MTDAQNYRHIAVEADRRLAEGKEALTKQAQQLNTVSAAGDPKVVEDVLLAYHAAATRLFNDYDSAIPNAQLFGAHEVEDWRRNQADTCLGLLEFILNHYATVRTYWDLLKLDTRPPLPSSGAYSQIQNMVRQYYPESASTLRSKFLDAELPTVGFEAPARSLASFRVTPGLVEASGFNSPDASEALQRVSSVHVDRGRASGALAEEGTARTVSALREGPGAKSSLTERLRDEIERAPIRFAIAVISALVAASLLAWWGIDKSSAPPAESPNPSPSEAPQPLPASPTE